MNNLTSTTCTYGVNFVPLGYSKKNETNVESTYELITYRSICYMQLQSQNSFLFALDDANQGNFTFL